MVREFFHERVERHTIPGLGDVPGLGHLFGRNRREAEQTDVVIMLTPHIIRTLDLVDRDLRPLRLPNEGPGGITILDGLPIVPPTVIPPRDPLPPSQTDTPQAPGTASQLPPAASPIPGNNSQ